MAPNLKNHSVQEDITEAAIPVGKERKEIFYDGYFYDVTDFISRHPGGDVISFYTEKGEDATQAIDQFHFRSKKKVDTILKGFRRRPALPHERGLDSASLSRHEALSADFKALFEELKAEGYFEPCLKHIILRLMECCIITLLGIALILEGGTVKMKLLGTLISGFGLSRFGWLQHECGHKSISGNPKYDSIIQKFCMCFAVGASAHWWNTSHSRHHAMPQRIHHDVDLDTLPFIAFHKKLVQDKKDYNSFFVKYQHILFSTLDMLLIGVAFKFYIHPKHQLQNGQYLEMLLNIPTFLLITQVNPVYFLLASYFFSFFMATNLFLNHTHLDVTDKPTHWVEYSLTHTANITPSIFVDYWMAYLNYQIEHHMFPTLPQFRHRQISGRVKALAEKHGMPYRVLSYPEAWKLAFGNLSKVGKELTND